MKQAYSFQKKEDSFEEIRVRMGKVYHLPYQNKVGDKCSGTPVLEKQVERNYPEAGIL